MYILMAVLFVVFLFFGLQVKYEEDITKLLPNSDVESQLAFSSIGLKDKIFIQVTSSEERLSPEELSERTDEFVDLLFEKDSSSNLIANVLYKLEPEMAVNALYFVLDHVPSFVDTSAYLSFEDAMVPENAEAQMQVNYELMMEDETGDVTQMVSYDPLNLRDCILGDLLLNDLGGYNIVEGHFFCADSTVCIAYLSPAFYSLNSMAATDFSKMLAKAQAEFQAAHPEVKVLYHGDPIGSVSNAGRIRSDLVVTVGMMVVLKSA